MQTSFVGNTNQEVRREGNYGICRSSLATVDTVQSHHKNQQLDRSYKLFPLILQNILNYSFPRSMLLYLFLLPGLGRGGEGYLQEKNLTEEILKHKIKLKTLCS